MSGKSSGTGFGTSQAQTPATGGGGPPFPSNSAFDGLSVDTLTGAITWGEPASGAFLGPAALLDPRQIDFNGNSMENIDGLTPGVFTQYGAGFYQMQDTNTGKQTNTNPGHVAILNISNNNSIDITDQHINFDSPTVLSSSLFIDGSSLFLQNGISTGTGTWADNLFELTDGTGLTMDLAADSILFADNNTGIIGKIKHDASGFTHTLNGNLGAVLTMEQDFQVSFGDLTNAANGTQMTIVDSVQQAQLEAANGLKIDVFNGPGITINGDTNNLMHTDVPWANHFAGGLGTLTNAPTAGDPTIWLGFDNAGQLLAVPAWAI